MTTGRQGPAPPSGEAGPHAELGIRHISRRAADHAEVRWQRIMASFVDDPRGAVAEAHQLADELIQRVLDDLMEERAALERQLPHGEDVSTEELRIALQRYRSVVARLLPSLHEGQTTH